MFSIHRYLPLFLALTLSKQVFAEPPYFDDASESQTSTPQVALGIVDIFVGWAVMTHASDNFAKARAIRAKAAVTRERLANTLAERDGDSRFRQIRGLEEAIAVLEGKAGCDDLLFLRATELAELHTKPLADNEKSLDDWHRLIAEASAQVAELAAREERAAQGGKIFTAIGAYLFCEVPGRIYIWEVMKKDPGPLPLIQLGYRAVARPVLRKLRLLEILEDQSPIPDTPHPGQTSPGNGKGE